MNKLKYIRIQNKDSSFGERFPIAVDSENVYMEEGINLQTQIENLHSQIADVMKHPPIINAMPIPVLTAAQMIDPTKIYLYVGQESGYLPGYWYYYNGYIWAFGGVYGTAITDSTLSQMGVPADAKAVGDSINAHAVTISGANDILTITIGGN